MLSSIVFALLGSSNLPPNVPNRGLNRPNIVLVLADDLGYGEIGAFGQSKIKTPNIDRLAEQGMRLNRFYAASTVCAPTRCSLMTGKHTGHSAIRGNKEIGGWGPRQGEGQAPLPSSETTIAEVLRTRGYATGVFGKWGLGGPASVGHPLNQGFDTFFGYLCQRVAHGHYPPYLWKDHDVYLLNENGYINPHQRLDRAPETPIGFARYTGPMYAPELMLAEALAFIDKNKEKPFFLYFPSTLPHAALQAPQNWIDQYPREWDAKPYLGESSYLPSERPRATYAAMISYLDHSVGQLVAKIDAMGLGDNTLIVFTSDNGATFNGGVDREFFQSNGPFRGRKTQLYEGGIRVPFVARWTGHIPQGGRSEHRAMSSDLFASFADLARAKAPRQDGLSLLPTLTGSGTQRIHEQLYFEFPEGNQSQALIRGSYKLVRPNLKQKGLMAELYDLSKDPSESQDLAAVLPEVVREMTARMDSARRPNPEFPLVGIDK